MDQLNIVVIGAGIAGLSCASTLINRGLQVRIFEATKQYGGRIKPLIGFANLKLEAGAQTIHSDKTKYLKLARQAGAKFDQSEEVVWDFSIFDPKTQKSMGQKEFFKNYSYTAHCNIHFIDDREEIEDDTVFERIQKKGYDQDFMHFFKAHFGAEYGASIDQISAKGIGIYEHLMELEDSDIEIINKTHHIDILNYHFKNAIEIIEFEKVVCSIELKDNKVYLHLNNGELVVADKVVCTIPITQMKKIKWIPDLEQNRKEQLNLVGMEKGGKFFIKLNKHINNHDYDELIIPKFDYHIVLWDNSNEKESIIIGLVVGDGYQRVLDLGIQNFSKEVIETINEQFKQKLTINATYFEDWGAAPFIEGLYSYPKKGASPNYRKIISQPIGDKVYFAGEAYHRNEYQTMHGAYESGVQIGNLL